MPTSLSSEQLVAVSRFLSKVLRHEPELLHLRLDAQGWVNVDQLVEAIAKAARAPGASKRVRTLPPVTREVIEAVVASNDKARFALAGGRIRAVQGHSTEVDLGHAVKEPPEVLFHGTAAASWPAIAAEGLNRGQRHAVHLSPDVETATRVGARHGRPLVLEVDSAQMHHEGFTFTQADNGVWLVAHVPPKYLKPLHEKAPVRGR